MNNVVFLAVIPLKRTFQTQGNEHCAHSANQTSAGRLETTPMMVPISHLVSPNFFGPLKETPGWQAVCNTCWQEACMTPTISCLDTHNNLFHTGIHALMPWRGTLKCQKVTTWKSDMYHLLSMCHVYMKFLAWDCLLPYFLKLIHSLVGGYQHFGILSTYQSFITQTTLLINIWLEKMILLIPS